MYTLIYSDNIRGYKETTFETLREAVGQMRVEWEKAMNYAKCPIQTVRPNYIVDSEAQVVTINGITKKWVIKIN